MKKLSFILFIVIAVSVYPQAIKYADPSKQGLEQIVPVTPVTPLPVQIHAVLINDSDYVKKAELQDSNYVKSEDLIDSQFVKSSALADSNYVKNEALLSEDFIRTFNIATKGYYKEFIALISQSSTNEPTLDVLYSTFDSDPGCVYIEEGSYQLNFSEPVGKSNLKTGKLQVITQDINGIAVYTKVLTDFEVAIYSSNGGMLNNGLLDEFYFHLIVFPD